MGTGLERYLRALGCPARGNVLFADAVQFESLPGCHVRGWKPYRATFIEDDSRGDCLSACAADTLGLMLTAKDSQLRFSAPDGPLAPAPGNIWIYCSPGCGVEPVGRSG